MKNIFYLLTGLAVVACGQQATAGWYDDVGASVLASQQSEAVAVPVDDDAAISDQAVDDDGDAPPVPHGHERIILGQPGIQENPANQPPDKDTDPPDPPMPVPDDSVSEAPLIDATEPREPQGHQTLSREPMSREPMPDATLSSDPVAIIETTPRAVGSSGTTSTDAATPHYHVRYVKKRKSMLQKMIDCERRKNAWIKKNILRL